MPLDSTLRAFFVFIRVPFFDLLEIDMMFLTQHFFFLFSYIFVTRINLRHFAAVK